MVAWRYDLLLTRIKRQPTVAVFERLPARVPGRNGSQSRRVRARKPLRAGDDRERSFTSFRAFSESHLL